MEKRSTRKRKIRAVILSVMLALLIFGLYTVLNLGQVFAEEILGELVSRQTKGYYALNFDDIKVDILEREIKVENLYLQADSVKISAETGLNTVYEIQLSELIINLKSILKFYFQKKLEIQSMRIVDPEIRMQRIGERETSTSFSFETGNLYKAISDYLTVLKVDYFRIQDGDLSYNEDQFSMGNIDFQIQNLLLDSVVRNDVFYSETIFLEIQNQKFFLPDSIHEIEFDRFVLSTQDSILRFENLSIHPTPNSGVSFTDNNQVNVYDIHIPELALKGIDYQSAYRNDHLVIDELSFSQPTIFIDDETHGQTKKIEKDNSLLKLLFNVFKKVEIGKLAVLDSEIDLKINSDKTYQRIKSEETSFSFYNILLDSTNYQFNQRAKYFENVEVSIKNYDYVLSDSIHEVQLNELNLSSKDSTLSLRNLKVYAPDQASQASINLEIPTIDLFGFVYDDLIKKNLTVKDLLIDRIDLQLPAPKKATTSSKRATDVSEIYQAIAPFFNQVAIDQLTVGRAGLELAGGISIGSATLDFTGFKLNESTRTLKDLFDLSYIGVKDIRIDRDSLHILGQQAELSHDLTEMKLSGWDLLVNTTELNINGSFESLDVVELDPDSLLHGNFMTFKKAFLNQPYFDVVIKRPAKKKKGSGLGIEKEILITDGNFSFESDSTAAAVSSIDVDFYLGDSIAIHEITADSIAATLKSVNHQLKLARLSYDTLNDEMHFVGLDVDPNDPNDSLQSLLRLQVPEVKIKGFEQDQFFGNQVFIASALEIDRPVVSAHTVKKASKGEKRDVSARIGSITLDSGFVALSGLSEQISTISLSMMDLDIEEFNYPESNEWFFAKTAALKLDAIQPVLANGNQLSIGRTTFLTNNSQLKIDSVRFSNENGSTDVLIPKTVLTGLKVEELIKHGRLAAADFSIDDPSFTISKADRAPRSNEVPTISLDLDRFNVNRFSIRYEDTAKQKAYALNEATLNFSNMQHEGSLDAIQLLQNTSSYALSGNELSIPINEHYSIETGAYSYESDQERFTLEALHLNPLQTKIDYSSHLTFQKDWFDASIDDLDVQGLNLLEVLSDSTLKITKVLLDGTDLYIYRDKKLPFPEDQIGLLPTEQILGIPYPLKVDTIVLLGDVAYEEQPDDFEQTGMISFDNLDVEIINFTNMDLEPNSMMHLHGSGQIVEEGAFDIQARFELARPDQRFSLTGKVVDLPLDSLNQMLGPVASVNIKSGLAEEIAFQFLANDTLAVGDMVFRYKDLKLQVLNRKKHEANLGSGLMSFFANTFVIRSRNPRFLFPRKGKIYFKRDQSKGIFNYWGKSILSGAVSSVGIHKSDREERKDTKSAGKEN